MYVCESVRLINTLCPSVTFKHTNIYIKCLCSSVCSCYSLCAHLEWLVHEQLSSKSCQVVLLPVSQLELGLCLQPHTHTPQAAEEKGRWGLLEFDMQQLQAGEVACTAVAWKCFMTVLHDCASWLCLMTVPHDCASWLCLMTVPHDCASWLCFMTVLHDCASWLCFMTVPHDCASWLCLMTVLHDCASWLCFMTVPHDCASWLCFMTVLHDCASWLCFMTVLHDCASWLCLMTVLHDCASWLCFMTVLHEGLDSRKTKVRSYGAGSLFHFTSHIWYKFLFRMHAASAINHVI